MQAAYDLGMQLFSDGRLKEAVAHFEITVNGMSVRTQLGGEARLQKAICLDSMVSASHVCWGRWEGAGCGPQLCQSVISNCSLLSGFRPGSVLYHEECDTRTENMKPCVSPFLIRSICACNWQDVIHLLFISTTSRGSKSLKFMQSTDHALCALCIFAKWQPMGGTQESNFTGSLVEAAHFPIGFFSLSEGYLSSLRS